LRWNQATSTIITDNSNWGSYASASDLSSTFLGAVPNNVNIFNRLYETAGCDPEDPIGFPTVIASENKHAVSNPSTTYSDAQFLAFSTDGSKPGIWSYSAAYYNSGGSVGAWNSTMSPTSPLSLSVPPLLVGNEYLLRWKERNPDIVVNSSGQQFVAWEKMYQYFDAISLTKIYISEINIRNTIYNGDWTGSLKTFNRDLNMKATNLNWEWLLNPSITAYPKSRLNNTTNVLTDQDPGITQIGFWNYHPNLVATDFYSEAPSLDGNSGRWWGTIPDGSGSWTQRSFGQYNAGPFFEAPPNIGWISALMSHKPGWSREPTRVHSAQ
jgi:hypothetical protein